MKSSDRIALTLTPDDTKLMRLGAQGLTFRIQRKQADLTLQDVADELAKAGDPLSTAMLSLFERGKKELRPATLERLEKIYGVSGEKSKENAEQRVAEAIVLPWLRNALLAGSEPKAKTAWQREAQQMRRELNALRYQFDSLQFQIKAKDKLIVALQQYNEKLEGLIREHKRRQNKAFYGESG